MNRKSRRSQKALEKKFGSKLDRIIDINLDIINSGDDGELTEDIFEVMVADGFDDALQRGILKFASKDKDFDVVEALAVFMDAATACTLVNLDEADTSGASDFIYVGEVFSIAISGQRSDVEGLWQNGSLKSSIFNLLHQSGHIVEGAALIALPFMLDMDSAGSVTPGVMSKINRELTYCVAHDIEPREEFLRALVGQETETFGNPEDFVTRVFVAAEVCKVTEAEEKYLGFFERNTDALDKHWFSEGRKVIPEVITYPPSYFWSSTVDASCMRISITLRSEARHLGFPDKSSFDKLEIVEADGYLMVYGVIEGRRVGPVGIPASILLYAPIELRESLSTFADEIEVVDRVVSN